MADVVDKSQRAKIMRSVASKGNKSTELKLIVLFARLGIAGWRRNYKVIGKPDFVFMKKKIAIFADGCFWHGHDCRNLEPESNADYWTSKIERNKARDVKVTKRFESRGWTVIRIWECDLKKDCKLAQAKLAPLLDASNARKALESGLRNSGAG